MAAREPSSVKCIISWCEQRADNICPDHLYALPLNLRQRWWRETDYNNSTAPAGLAVSVNRAIQAGLSEPPPSLRGAAAAWRKRAGRNGSDATKVVNRACAVSGLVLRRMASAVERMAGDVDGGASS